MASDPPPGPDTARGGAVQAAEPAAEAAAADLARRAEATAAAGPDAVRAAAALAEVETDLLRLRRDLHARHGTPLGAGHPVLPRVAAWREAALRAGVAEGSRAADDLLQDLLRDEADRWRRGAAEVAASGDPDRCLEALGQATLFDTEALSLRRAGEDGPPPLEGDRLALREAFLAAEERRPPPPEVRDRRARALVDRADVVLTGLDEVPPARAALHLEVVGSDLDWYLAQGEREAGPRRRRLARKRRRLRHERQERGLQGRLEARFGERRAARFERLVIGLVFLVIALLLVEALVDLPRPVAIAFTALDTLACAVFLADFFVRLALVEGKGSWLLRHVWVDFLPSLPFGLLVLGWGHADPVRAGRLVRLLRLPQAARSVRLLLPVIRLVRAAGFFARGMDALARRYGHLLNRDVILHPTLEERAAARRGPADPLRRLRHAEGAVEERWQEVLSGAAPGDRDAVVRARVDGLGRARREGLASGPAVGGPPPASRAVPADVLLHRLESATPQDVEQDLGADLLARLARPVRWVARPPLRWLPGLARVVPRLAPRMGDAQVVAAAARSLAAGLRRQRERWLWFADLYGTVTPAEFVDRVGTAMVRGSFGPAYRLTVFGVVFLLAQLVLAFSQSSFVQWLHDVLNRVVGTTLIVVGGVCFVILGVGWWLKRLASEATAFYEQVAAARFLPLMESVKGRHLARDAAFLDARVFAPEARLRDGRPDAAAGAAPARRARFEQEVRAWLLEAHARGEATPAPDPVERTVLLYRDALNGGLLTTSDVRTTTQLLGNPAMRDLRRRCRRVDRAERKALRRIDLERQRSMFRGPYLWFSFVTTALEHSVARLIVDYNVHAVPRGDLPLASRSERDRHAAWLERRVGAPAAEAALAAVGHATTEFTALHFLDDDPRRDREVGERFGDAVLRRLREDRRLLFRRVFGTYPFHERPREERVLNLYGLYEAHLAGGRAFLFPFRVLRRGLRRAATFLSWTVRAVREIRRPALRQEVLAAAGADFGAALRKIDRMRSPVLRACLWLRARLDVEYLGLPLPGGAPPPGRAPVDADLRFLGDPPDLAARLAEERRRARADLARLAALRAGGLLGRALGRVGAPGEALASEHVRAAAVAYRGDLDGVRSLLSAGEILREAVEAAASSPLLPARLRPAPRLARAFRRWWAAEPGRDPALRRATWRRVRHDVDGAGAALAAWAERGPDGAREAGEVVLGEILRHPARVSEQVVTLRAIHSLALIDTRNYREHVWRLGRYAEDGEEAPAVLDLPGEP